MKKLLYQIRILTNVWIYICLMKNFYFFYLWWKANHSKYNFYYKCSQMQGNWLKLHIWKAIIATLIYSISDWVNKTKMILNRSSFKFVFFGCWIWMFAIWLWKYLCSIWCYFYMFFDINLFLKENLLNLHFKCVVLLYKRFLVCFHTITNLIALTLLGFEDHQYGTIPWSGDAKHHLIEIRTKFVLD